MSVTEAMPSASPARAAQRVIREWSTDSRHWERYKPARGM